MVGRSAEVQRANMLLGDIGETLSWQSQTSWAKRRMRLFHPLGFMLASPAESAEEALSYFENALVEDKYDGIRAQAHCSGGAVKFSRALGTTSRNLSPNCRMPWRVWRKM